jgi:hypothetical protein
MPKLFNCATCAAPLDAEAINSATVRCTYCGNTIIVPEALGDTGGSGGSLIDQALKLAEVARLAKAGKKIPAIKLYREVFHVGLKEAKDAVEQIEHGGMASHAHPPSWSDGSTARKFASVHTTPDQPTSAGNRKAALWIVATVAFVIVIGGAVAAFLGFAFMVTPTASRLPETPSRPAPQVATTRALPPPPAPAFADAAFEFGSEGIGAGQFKDARSIAIDGEGRIYVGEYSGGRVQVFDSQGQFLTQWMADTNAALLNLAADRKGNVYVVHPSSIYRYEGATGRLLGEVPKPSSNPYESYYDVFVALDGSLFAVGGHHNIFRIGPDGESRLVVNVREKTGEGVSLRKVAVDGTGHIYALDSKDDVIMKFAPDGRFINRFGGRGNLPGQLRGPHAIAVDGQGRVYVSDFGRAVEVFDGGGRYIGTFGGTEIVFGLVVNDRGEIFTTHRNRHKIVKYILNANR